LYQQKHVYVVFSSTKASGTALKCCQWRSRNVLSSHIDARNVNEQHTWDSGNFRI